MANITTRQTQAPQGQPQVTVAGAPLTNVQLDNNFINLNTELSEKLPLAGGTITGNLTINEALSTNSTSSNIIKQPQGAVAGNISTVGLDFSQYGNFYVTLSTNVTFTFDNLTNQTGSSGYIFLKQDATGGRTITLPSVAKTPGGRALVQVTTSNSLSVITYYVVDTNTVIVNYIADFK